MRVPVSCIGPPGQAAVEQRLALAQHDRDHGHEQLVQQARVRELRGDVAAADDPQVALASRRDHLVVEIRDLGVDDPDVDLLALRLGQVSRAQDPGGLALVGPLVQLVEDELVGRRAHDQRADAFVEAVVGALDRLDAVPFEAALVLEQPVERVVGSRRCSRPACWRSSTASWPSEHPRIEARPGRCPVTLAGPSRPVFGHARTRIQPPEMSLRPLLEIAPRTSGSARWRAPPATGRSAPVHMSASDPALPARRAGRGRGGARRPAGADRHRRRQLGARPGARAARLPGASPRPLLPVARHRLRLPRGAAAAPRRPADRRAGRARRLATARRRWWSPAPSRSPRRCPTRRCARPASRSSAARRSTSARSPTLLVEAGYERVDQVEERGQFAVRGGILDVFGRPRSAPCGSSCSATRSSRCAGSRPSPSARSATPSGSSSRRRRSSPPSIASSRSWRSRTSERAAGPRASCCPLERFRAPLELIPRRPP